MAKRCKFANKKKLSIRQQTKESKSPKANTIDEAVLKKIIKLKNLLNQQDKKCWAIGDMCIELLDEHHLQLGQIAHFTNYSKTRISHFHLTSRTFGTDNRQGYTFQDSLTARQIYFSLPRLGLSPIEIREDIVKMRNKTVGQVKEHFVQLLMKREMHQNFAQPLSINKNNLINNCHLGDWREVIPQLPPESVQLFICDPPFNVYKDERRGGYVSSRSATNGLRIDCDNGRTEEESLAVTLPLFELCLPILKDDGILILFQAGGRPDRLQVLQKAQECGWDCPYALSWNKGNTRVGSFQNPYNISTERILVFCKKGQPPKKFQDGLTHGDILDFPTTTKELSNKIHHGKMKYADFHMFQKPIELMEFLVKHHSYPGDLVVEPFGCSGSGVIAAAHLQRQWVYIESNEQNYHWGSKRVFSYVKSLSTKVS